MNNLQMHILQDMFQLSKINFGYVFTNILHLKWREILFFNCCPHFNLLKPIISIALGKQIHTKVS